MSGDDVGRPAAGPDGDGGRGLDDAAFDGADRTTVKLRLAAADVRSVIGTEMVCSVCPGPKVEHAPGRRVVGAGHGRAVLGGVLALLTLLAEVAPAGPPSMTGTWAIPAEVSTVSPRM